MSPRFPWSGSSEENALRSLTRLRRVIFADCSGVETPVSLGHDERMQLLRCVPTAFLSFLVTACSASGARMLSADSGSGSADVTIRPRDVGRSTDTAAGADVILPMDSVTPPRDSVVIDVIQPTTDVPRGADVQAWPDVATLADTFSPPAQDTSIAAPPDVATCKENGLGCASPSECCTNLCGGDRRCGSTCIADGVPCVSGRSCCTGACNPEGTCGPRECGETNAQCYQHSECCDGVRCTNGYCGGSPGNAITGVMCWAHGQCITRTCSEEGYCVNTTSEFPLCRPGGMGCFIGNDCCSGVCQTRAGNLTCMTPARGHWLE